MTVQSLTIDQLVVSPYNVRQNEEDANATGALEESILETGIWLPFVVHPMTPDALELAVTLGILPPSYLAKGRRTARAAPLWGVHDGGRRMRAVRRLADAGRLPREWPIDCIVRDEPPAKLTELSLGAFLLTRDLRPYEVSAAIVRMLEQGMEPEEIARNLGQRPEWVAQQLRLGGLAPEIFTAVAAGEVSIEQAQAYAATEDQALQRAAFAHFAARHPFDRHPEYIRSWMKVGDRELARLLRFVGEEVYRAAGGTYELDLFAGDANQRGRVADEGKLREMVENKLGFTRQELRRRTGRSDLRFIPEVPKFAGHDDRSLMVEPEQLGAGSDSAIVLPAGDVVAMLEIRDSPGAIGPGAIGSEVRTTWWWESRKAQADAQRALRRGGKSAQGSTGNSPAAKPIADGAALGGDPGSHYGMQARAAVRDEHGLSADGLQVVRSLRRELLRAQILTDAYKDGTLGRDYIIWVQLREELKQDRQAALGARGLASLWTCREDAEPRDTVLPHLEQSHAHAWWLKALSDLQQQDWMTIADPARALAAYLDEHESVKNLAGAVLAGLALLRSANVPGWRVPAHDLLAARAGGDDAALGMFWHPTPDFLALFPKMKRLELVQHALGGPGVIDAADAADLRALSTRKDAEVTRAAADRLVRLPRWIHPLLSFGVDRAEQEVAEAAE